MNPQSRPSAQSFNPYIGAFFVVAGLTAVFTGSAVIGGAFLSVGAAFLVYWRDTRPWAEIPRWKRVATFALLLVGAGFLVASLLAGGK